MKHTEKHHPGFSPTQNVINTHNRGLGMTKKSDLPVLSQMLWTCILARSQKILLGIKAWENPCSPIPNYQEGEDVHHLQVLTIWAWGIALETKRIQREEENQKQLWEGNLDNITQFRSAWLTTKWLRVQLCFPTFWNHYFKTKRQLKLAIILFWVTKKLLKMQIII